ncbi:2-hydroxychromene-2-carboxylate isomerase [uncultured Marivita sp.]|uniref:2-hydroxychromene-2-carboxylate isomerase n=1 Tax=uncultured Marivita sp. TaxID=888080 RepID=UPI0026115CCA|nr:2-hydroxychromene-2-carboxylate isomerase [uncultured Marivita sp.]
MQAIDFWYSIGSTYSYLTVMRLDDYCEAEGISVNWRPFNVRAIMVEQNNVPFKDKPVKTAYMWRDIERRADLYGLPLAVPAPYPLEHLVLANQVALLGMQEGWGKSFTIASYRAWFVDGLPAGSDPNLSNSLKHAGQEPTTTIERAQSPAVIEALDRETRTCKALGVFGSPSFVVGREVFWGDDRLDDAIKWAKDRTLHS